MAKKRQTQAISISTPQYEESLAKFASNHIQIKKLKAEMEEQIHAVREEYDSDIALMEAEQKLLMTQVRIFCIQNRENMFGEARSIATLYGRLGFRKNTPSLKTLSGFTWDKVLANLKEHLPTYVRTVEEPDKEKLLVDRALPEVAGKLADVGVKVSQEDNFYIELKEETPAPAIV